MAIIIYWTFNFHARALVLISEREYRLGTRTMYSLGINRSCTVKMVVTRSGEMILLRSSGKPNDLTPQNQSFHFKMTLKLLNVV